MRTILLAVPAFCGAIAAAIPVSAIQEPPTKTIWEGVYTAAQARRGEQAYQASCSYCHRDDLSGGFFDNGVGRAPALAGPQAFGSSFAERWKNLSIGEMTATVAAKMPQDRPASLTVQSYVDIVGYLLSKNGVPPGERELSTDIDALGRILIVDKP